MTLLRMSTVRGWLMGFTVLAAFAVGGLGDGPTVELTYPAQPVQSAGAR